MRNLARVVGLVGAAGVAYVLLSGGPKDVVLVYELPGTPRGGVLEVELRRGAEVVRRAEFRLPPGDAHEVRQALRLPAGDYTLAWRIAAREDGDHRGERPLEVKDDGTIVLALGS